MAQLSPLISEFATSEEAQAHDLWIRAKVHESLNETRPPVAHDEAMRRIRLAIEDGQTLE